MKVKLFTMVKNEVDIIEYWINYHGSVFGYRNLHIIDNNSDDGTYEKILKYKKIGVNIHRESDYKLKGTLITNLINNQKKRNRFDVAFPIDIDEFIVHYDKTHNTLNPNHTKKYINELLDQNKENGVFKMNYVENAINSGDKYGYKNALLESTHGIYLDYGNMAKTFFNVNKWDGELDHGNHYCCENYLLSDLVLVHYHCRNLDQMKKKVRTNLLGFGYKLEKDYLEKLLCDNKTAPGSHHINHMFQILNNTFSINTRNCEKGKSGYICLDAVINFFLKLSINES